MLSMWRNSESNHEHETRKPTRPIPGGWRGGIAGRVSRRRGSEGGVMKTQVCGKCGVEYPATAEHFRRTKKRKDGISNVCRVCCRADAKQYREDNPIRIKESRREFYVNHPGYSSQYIDPERQKVRAKRHYEANKETVLRRVAEWKLSNPELARLHNRIAEQQRRSRIRNAGGSYTADELIAKMIGQVGLCYWCKHELDLWEIDHYIPLSRGGSNHIQNIVISCPTCNRSKHNRLPTEWKANRK